MSKLRAYLELVRLPAVFTAMADVFLGFLLVRSTLEPAVGFLALLTASSCLYLAGMVFNDVFDRKADARERPARPIPSGRVSLKGAVGLGIALVLAGLAAAWRAGPQSLLVAGVLTGFIFLYDGLLKRTPAGPVGMGICRLLNVLLGASFIGPEGIFAMHLSWTDLRLPPVLARPQLPVAVSLGVYVTGVTWFARREAGGSSRVQLGTAAVVVNLGLVGLIALMTGVPGLLRRWLSPGQTEPAGVLVALAVIALILNRRMVAAIFEPAPAKVQPAVKTLLLSIIVLDAILIYFHRGAPGTSYAVATALLIVPSVVIGRWLAVT